MVPTPFARITTFVSRACVAVGGSEQWLHEHVELDMVCIHGVPAVLRAIEAGLDQTRATQARMVRVAFVIRLKESGMIMLDPPASLFDCLGDAMAQDEPPAVHVSHHALSGHVPAQPKYESPVVWAPSDRVACGNWIPLYATSLYDSSGQPLWVRSLALLLPD